MFILIAKVKTKEYTPSPHLPQYFQFLFGGLWRNSGTKQLHLILYNYTYIICISLLSSSSSFIKKATPSFWSPALYPRQFCFIP